VKFFSPSPIVEFVLLLNMKHLVILKYS